MIESCGDVVGWNHGNPVVGVSLLVIVIVRVVEQLVGEVIGIDLGLWIQVFEHLSVSISVPQLGVVVEWNSREWVEVVWINGLGLWHSFLISNSLFLSGTSGPLGVHEHDGSEENWVKSEMRSVVHSSESGECI